MKIKILGSGSAFGAPMIFNSWGRLNPNNSKNNRTRSSLFLDIDGYNILVDAGPDLRTQINKNNITNIDAVFVTHSHYDHTGGIPELPRAAKILDHSIDIYATKETLIGLKENFGYLFNSKAEEESNSSYLHWKEIPSLGKVKIGDIDFTTFTVFHHKLHPSGFRYKNCAYVTDWSEISDEVLCMVYDLDLLIIECNDGLTQESTGHAYLDKVKEICDKIKPKKVILSHLSWRVDYDDFQKYLPANFSLAYDGMNVEI